MTALVDRVERLMLLATTSPDAEEASRFALLAVQLIKSHGMQVTPASPSASGLFSEMWKDWPRYKSEEEKKASFEAFLAFDQARYGDLRRGVEAYCAWYSQTPTESRYGIKLASFINNGHWAKWARVKL